MESEADSRFFDSKTPLELCLGLFRLHILEKICLEILDRNLLRFQIPNSKPASSKNRERKSRFQIPNSEPFLGGQIPRRQRIW